MFRRDSMSRAGRMRRSSSLVLPAFFALLPLLRFGVLEDVYLSAFSGARSARVPAARGAKATMAASMNLQNLADAAIVELQRLAAQLAQAKQRELELQKELSAKAEEALEREQLLEDTLAREKALKGDLSESLGQVEGLLVKQSKKLSNQKEALLASTMKKGKELDAQMKAKSSAAKAPAAGSLAAVAGKTVAAEYMVSDKMIEEFYQKTISGSGGLPPKGIIMDLVIKHFLGTFDAKTRSFTRTSSYKGPPPQLPGKNDLPPAMELLRQQMKAPAFVNKGGPALDETDRVEDDGKGWVWLAADMSPGGFAISLFKSVPYGKRPLLIAKQGDVDGMLAKISWDVVLQRFEETMGSPQIKQR